LTFTLSPVNDISQGPPLASIGIYKARFMRERNLAREEISFHEVYKTGHKRPRTNDK
jgi:hypothetical protein